MSRRGYASSEIYEERERDHYEPSSHGRRDRTLYAEDVEFHERRRAPERDRQPEFLREDYGRREAGPLVVREEKRERSIERPRRKDIEIDETIVKRGTREKERERPRERDYVAEEVVVARGGRERPRERREEFVERDEYERDIVYRPREREVPHQQIRSEREEFLYRRGNRERDYEREVPPPPIRSEREEYVFRAPKVREQSPEPERERTEISIREKSRGPPRGRDYRDEEDIIIRRDERSRGPPRERGRGFEEEDIIIRRDERSRGPPRERDRVFDEEIIIDRDRRRPRAASYERESLTISEVDKPRAKSRGDFRGEEEKIIIRRGEREPRPRTPPREEEQIIIRRGERDPRPRSPPREEEQIIIRHDEGRSRAGSRGRFDEEDIVFRRGGGERERFRERSVETHRGDHEDITFKHDEKNGRHKDELIIRRNERSPSPEPIPEPPRAPEPTRAPPIVQEIITHHRHIDHGFERAPVPEPPPRARTPPPPPRPRTPSPVRDERIEIRTSGSRNGRRYDEDIVFERETGGRRQLDGVRRSERHEEPVEESREVTIIDTRDRGRRFEAEKPKKDRMWTEITKDLVSEEALKESGKEYEETEQFYYVMEYLRYEDVLALVELTEDIKRDRRERIREIQVERDFADRPRRPLALPPPPWDEERVVEREIIYSPPPRRYR